MYEEDKLIKVHHDWMLDILKRIREALKSDIEDFQKVAVVEYLVKQGLKVERED